MSTVPGFHQAVADLPSRQDVTIDLSAVEFIDSAGLGALIGEIHRSQEDGTDLELACDRASLRHLLHITGVDRIVRIVRTPDEAVPAGSAT
jgi:anti-sigma B factor antagonist